MGLALRVSVSSPWGRVRRKDRPVEIQGHTWKCFALEALDDQGGREVANVLDTLGVYVRKGTGDGGHGGQFAYPQKAANEGIVPIPVDIAQAAEAEQQVDDQEQHNEMMSKDR